MEETSTKDKILPAIIAGLKLFFFLLSVVVLSTLTYYQFSFYIAPVSSVVLPINFILDNIPALDEYRSQESFRSEQLLQGNFSLLAHKHLDHQIFVGTEYTINLKLDLADYEVNYHEGMFLVCLKIFDINDEVTWPPVYQWSHEKHSEKYGQCRSTILLRDGFSPNGFVGNMLWTFWSITPFYRPKTKQLSIKLEDHYEQNTVKRCIKGMVTIISRNLQVVDSEITFKPVTSFTSRNPIIVSLLAWVCIFTFWFVAFSLVQIYD